MRSRIANHREGTSSASSTVGKLSGGSSIEELQQNRTQEEWKKKRLVGKSGKKN